MKIGHVQEEHLTELKTILNDKTVFFIAGIDGYSVDFTQNFVVQKINIFTQKAIFETMDVGLNTILREYSRQIAIEFVTTPRYVTI